MTVTRLSRFRRVAVRATLALSVATGLAVGVGPAAHAAAENLVCTAGGAMTISQQGDQYGWSLSGVGACTVPNRPAQVRQVTLAGTATTDSLGLCSGDAVVNAFSMHVTATFASVSSGSTVQEQTWSLPATTFPVVSPFAITDAAGSTIGAGEFATHILVQCPPNGQPTMQVNWVQSA
jgi:hypothetical protein